MPQSEATLEFTVDQFDDVREGHVTLDWTAVDAATVYSVTDERNVEVFRGTTPQAFVSGLPDGQHVFTVAAMDGQGQVLVQSPTPAVVTVKHWSLGMALSLFVCGFVVLLAVVGVLVLGTRNARSRSDASE
ncbi:hypothetical protein [Roseimaritima ulvae]|uniref:Fibronectin type-III domain-containing protein n=1 Tax=Roseimaritima ulvae TaxID=980254 RepID=A0A5B9QQ89_9BACT|nr:hypothetical protein [Roseimaritima ulvae]QEG39206.1 hypothetical protein UC8_11670 [Roseimaritima ulvae]